MKLNERTQRRARLRDSRTGDISNSVRPFEWVSVGIHESAPQRKVVEAQSLSLLILLELPSTFRCPNNSGHLLKYTPLHSPNRITFQ